MRVAVVGVGQLGQAILQAARIKNLVPGKALSGKKEKTFYFGLPHEKADVCGPVEDLCEALAVFKPTVVINTAAYHVTRSCEDLPEKAFFVNAIGAHNVALACVHLRAMHIYISTDYVFSSLVRNDSMIPGMFDRMDRPQPTTVYGISKVAGEVLTLKTSPNSAIARVSHLFGGSGSKQKGGNFVLKVLRDLRDRKPLEYYENVFFSPTFCKDAARMVLSIESPGIYHACNLGATTPYRFAREIVRLEGGNPEAVRATVFEDDVRDHFAHPRVTSMRPSFESARRWEVALAEYLPEAKQRIAKD